MSASRKALPLVWNDFALVAHVDGYERNDSQENLDLTFRSCNAKGTHSVKRLGIGPRTRPYNPRGQAAQTLVSSKQVTPKLTPTNISA